nr:Ulp1 family isopeptidase [Mesorhizobium onobrychidis]
MPIAGRAKLSPYPQDAALIKEYRNAARTPSGRRNATALRSFSDYLRQNNKKGIVGRLSDDAFDVDVKVYKEDADDRCISAALAHLRESDAGAKAMELERHTPVPDPKDAAPMELRRGGEAIAQHSASQEAGSWPKELPAAAHDQDVLLGLMDEQGLSSSAPQPSQSSRLLRRLSKLPLYPEDTSLILGLEEALIKGNATEPTAKNSVRSLLSFGQWLFEKKKDPIKDRLDQESLTEDALTFIGERDPARILTAINHLRTSQSMGGVVPIAGRAKLSPYPQDAALIKEYRDKINENGHKAAIQTGKRNSAALRSFSDYLRQHNKKGIVGRLSGEALDGDVKVYKEDAYGNRSIGSALTHLRKSDAGAKAMELERHTPAPDPEGAALMEPRRGGEAIAQHSASQEGGSWPKELPAAAHDQDALLGLMDEQGLSSSAPQPAKSARLGRNQPLYPEDTSLILGLEKALIKGKASEHTVNDYVRSVRSFGRWLFANNKDPIKDRLDHGSLTEDAREFLGKRNPKTLLPAIAHLRTSQSTEGVVLIAGRAELTPHPEDAALIAALIKEYRDKAAIQTGKRNATALRSFSDYLRQNNKKGIAGRLSGKALAEDVKAYKKDAGGDSKIGSALIFLRNSDAGTKAMELERHIPPVLDPEDAALMEPRRVGEAIAQHSAWQEAGGWPKEPPAADHDQHVPLELIDQPGLSPSAPQPAQSTRLGRKQQRLYPQDASLILGLEEALIKNNAAEFTVKNNVRILRNFGSWLFENKKTSIVARLNRKSLSDDGVVFEFIGEGDPRKLVTAIGHLRTLRSTGVAGRAKLNRPTQNVTLINSEGAAPMESRRVGDAAAQHGASHQAGNWAQELPAKAHDQEVLLGPMDQPGLSSSLEPAAHHDQAPDPGVSNHQRSPDELMGAPAWSNLLPSEEVLIEDELDTAELRPAKRQRILDDLQGLAAERQLSEIANSGGRLLSPAATHQLGASPWEARPMMQGSGYEDAAAPHAIATSVGDAAAQQGPVSWPSVGAEGYGQDLMVEDGPPWSGVPPEQAQDIVQAGWQEAARSTSTLSLQMPLNFDWSMWPTSEPAPVHYVRARSETYGDFEAAVDPNPPGPVPGHHQDARQPGSPLALSPLPDSSDEEAMAWLSQELERRQMLRDTEWQSMMQGTGSAAVPGAGEPNEVQLIHHPRPRPMGEVAPAAPARASQPASPATASLPGTYRGLPVVDVTTLTTSSSDAQIGAFGPTASSKVANGSVLGATEWLSDAHIQRDYHLLEGQLQGIDPELAARTRLVDPSVSHLLRHAGSNTAQHTLQSIYNQSTAPADFLFLPVNNGTPTNPGTHWSLLLVDRREPEIPVAYHYDSRQREGYNDGPATQLAGLLNATLAPAPMARQPNDYDCGVFVLDGTWALVGRLVEGQRPDREPLPLDNLVADRQALQDRLSGRLPHEEEPRQLLDDEPASPPMMAFEPGELRQLLEDEPASPPMMAFDSAELWRLLDDEPASSSPRINSTRHARTDGVHQPTQAPWPPQRKT